MMPVALAPAAISQRLSILRLVELVDLVTRVLSIISYAYAFLEGPWDYRLLRSTPFGVFDGVGLPVRHRLRVLGRNLQAR